MDEFCPLCRKNGCNNKIKPVQLNFHEAVYLCESETCHWPYGYEEFKIIPRSIDKMGKILPKKLNNTKNEVQKIKDGSNVVPISTELSMYTPPVTPSNDNLLSSSASSPKQIVKGDSYASINNSTSKSTVVLSVTTIKNENTPLKVPSIFDIDSSITLSTENFDKSQHKKSNCSDIKTDDEKNIKPAILNNEYTSLKSNQLSKSLPQIRKVEVPDINVDNLKLKKKIKSTIGRKSKSGITSDQLYDQTDMKFGRKVVILGEKSSNTVSVTEDKQINHLSNCKRPTSNDKSCIQIIKEQSPKKISRLSYNPEQYDKINCGISSEFRSELTVQNPNSIIKNSNTNTNIDNPIKIELPNVNNINVSSMKSKESSIINNINETTNNIVDNTYSGVNLNLDNLIDENFLNNCPNTSEEIDDDWLQSLLS